MEKQTITAFDESGHTGGGLLDKTQPVFVLTSVRLTMDQADELKQLFNVPEGHRELKFNKLKKYPKHQKAIVELLNHKYLSANTVKIAAFHKEYCIWAYTVDRVIEPVFYDVDFDTYKNGLNIALTNLLHYCTPVFCTPAIVDDYKKAFLKLFKNKNTESIYEFYAIINALKTTCKDEKFKDILDILLSSQTQIDSILDGHKPLDFDPYISAFMYQIDHWGRASNGKFDAYVDEYKGWKDFKQYLNLIKEIAANEMVGMDRRTMQLPLKIGEVIPTNSETNSVVQIADLVAGAAQHYLRSLADGNKDKLFLEIEATKVRSFIDLMVWPHDAFTPEDTETVYTGGTNILDDLVRLSRKK